MATADTSASPGADQGAPGQPGTRRLAILGPVVVLVLGAVVLGVVLFRDRSPEVAPEPDPVAVDASSTYDFASIEQMVAASDLVVRARVVATARGEVLGADGTDPASTGLVVRDVTLEVDEVWHTGAAAGLVTTVRPGDQIVMAEEGWLTTGEPLIVDGLGPSTVGDDGAWFLQAIPTDRTGDGVAGSPSVLVINSQGRYLSEDGDLTGAKNDDPLVRTVERLTLDQLAAAVRG